MSWPFALGRAYEKLRLLVSYCKAGDVKKAQFLFRSPEECPLCTEAGISSGEPECKKCVLTGWGQYPELSCINGDSRSRIRQMVACLSRRDLATAADLAGDLMTKILLHGPTSQDLMLIASDEKLRLLLSPESTRENSSQAVSPGPVSSCGDGGSPGQVELREESAGPDSCQP